MHTLCKISLITIILTQTQYNANKCSVKLEQTAAYMAGKCLNKQLITTGQNKITLKLYNSNKRWGNPQPLVFDEETSLIDQTTRTWLGQQNWNSIAPKVVFMAHGFWDKAANSIPYNNACEEFVKKFLLLDKNYQVVCIDWSKYAKPEIFPISLVGFALQTVYCLDIGNFLGNFLKEFIEEAKIGGSQIHLIGHSLGGHLVGEMARQFKNISSGPAMVERVTGLDPAGPGFFDVDTTFYGVNARKISPDVAEFVDIIHTSGSKGVNGALANKVGGYLGFLPPLGHTDFYANGGSRQPVCDLVNYLCHHTMAKSYFLKSIQTKNKALFMVNSACHILEENNCIRIEGDVEENHMGFYASKKGSPISYYADTTADFDSAYKAGNLLLEKKKKKH